MKKKTELLAPVGGMEQLQAAVENGADAVYLGGEFFNARMKADNFSQKDLETAIDQAHVRNVKVYVTLNTLISDDEMDKALKYAEGLREIGADALIIQDLGLAHLINSQIGDLPMHLSTQGTVYNSSGVALAKSIGFKRVVLAREMTLKEIKAICDKNICEIEIFVHGALCMCYSGQCQLSRYIGGRSGNKGACAQPCRMLYTRSDEEKGYYLSPKDLCGLELLPDIVKAGVDSIKIEGRMKSAEYVALTVSKYRKYLDVALEGKKIRVTNDDREELKQIFSRGDFSTGYFKGSRTNGILSGASSKHQGIYMGKVSQGNERGALVDVAAVKEFHMGDIFEIRGKPAISGRISWLEQKGKGILRIGDIREKVCKGAPVYRLVNEELMKKARATYTRSKTKENRTCGKRLVNMVFTVKEGGHPVISVSGLGKGQKFTYTEENFVGERALKKPLDEDTVKRHLKKTGGTPFSPGEIRVYISGEPALPAACINNMRRKALETFQEAVIGGYKRPYVKVSCPSVIPEKRIHCKGLYFYLGSNYAKKGREFAEEYAKWSGDEEFNIWVPVEDLVEMSLEPPAGMKAKLLPYIRAVSKGILDSYLDSNFERVCRAVKDTGICIGNLGWIKEFLGAGITVYGDAGLNIYNGSAVALFEKLGVVSLAMSLETEEFSSGPVPLMITEHPLPEGGLMDRKGVFYPVVKLKDKWLLLSPEDVSVGKKVPDKGTGRIYVL